MATKLLDRMLARRGKTRADVQPNSALGKRLRAQGVGWSPELDRVVALPRRVWQDQDVVLLQDEITDWLRVATGTQRLRPVQAAALAELHDLGGLFGVILVGGGKTLITRLAPLVVEATRPILLVPAKLIGKTQREFAALDKHWAKHPDLEIISYEKLGRVSGATTLEERQPDLIIADEVHKLKNLDAAVTRRVEAWMEESPETIFCALSGTITKRSLMDFHHLLRWSLGREHMPLPAIQSEAMSWARALDEKLQGIQRMAPGELKVFVGVTDREVKRDEAREGYSRRLKETSGVIATDASAVDASIVGTTWEPELPDDIKAHIEHLKQEWETPAGDICRMPVDLWRHARELVCGFFYRWDPEPPEDWRKARSAWFQFVRQVLGDRTPGLDSPLQVSNACARGLLHSGSKYEKWQTLKDSFKPNNVPVWVSTSVLEQLLGHVAKADKSIIWVEHVAVGVQLHALSGMPFFSRGGLDATGRPIDDVEGKETIIASISSNAEGRNLQAWAHNSIVSPPPNGGLWEQLMGRTHREGQLADEVYFDIMLGDAAIREGMRQALRDARYIEQTTGTPQKLLLASLNIDEPALHNVNNKQKGKGQSNG